MTGLYGESHTACTVVEMRKDTFDFTNSGQIKNNMKSRKIPLYTEKVRRGMIINE